MLLACGPASRRNYKDSDSINCLTDLLLPVRTIIAVRPTELGMYLITFMLQATMLPDAAQLYVYEGLKHEL